jgi:hypothetical protein
VKGGPNKLNHFFSKMGELFTEKSRLSFLRAFSRIGKLKRKYIAKYMSASLIREVQPRNLFALLPDEVGVFELANDKNMSDADISVREKERRIIEGLRLLPKVVNRLAERFRETDGQSGVILEYHQKVPLAAILSGYALIKLGEVGVSRWRAELEEILDSRNFDSRVEVKFGRRSGKTYMECFAVALLICTQRKCSGILMCLDGGLAGENVDKITEFIGYIIEDPNQVVRNVVLEDNKRSEGIIKVRSHAGTVNKVKCTANPTRSNLRGLGNFEGFFFADESDFYPERVWTTVAPIWSMPVMVCLCTSQGHSMSAASRMIDRAILANGLRVWRQYRIKPGRVSLIISEDYAKLDNSSVNQILFGKKASTKLGDTQIQDAMRSIRRPWYNPVMQTLAMRLYQLTSDKGTGASESGADTDWTFKRKRKQRRQSKKKKDKSDANGNQTAEQEEEEVVITPEMEEEIEERFIRRRNNELERLVTDIDKSRADNLSTPECIWLLTLPGQQDVNQMLKLKADMDPKDFAVEMLSDLPELALEMHPSFDLNDVDRFFLPENRFREADKQQPLRWLIGYDPNGGTLSQTKRSSDAVFWSALVFPPPVREAGETAKHAIELVQSRSLQQHIVVRERGRGRVGEGEEGLAQGPRPRIFLCPPGDPHLKTGTPPQLSQKNSGPKSPFLKKSKI